MQAKRRKGDFDGWVAHEEVTRHPMTVTFPQQAVGYTGH